MAFTIKLSILSGLGADQVQMAANATLRWERAILGCRGALADELGLRIDLFSGGLGNPGMSFAKAQITQTWPASGLPRSAEIWLEEADIDTLTAQGRFQDIVAHEIGHCLGFGLLWNGGSRKLLRNGDGKTLFTGGRAIAEYQQLVGPGSGQVEGVPVEDDGGSGQNSLHWQEGVFGNELMTTTLPDGGNRLSRMTLASLHDLGYEVDLATADTYLLPSPGPRPFDAGALTALKWELPGRVKRTAAKRRLAAAPRRRRKPG